MRMYGYLKEPYKCNSITTIYKVMIHEIEEIGTYIIIQVKMRYLVHMIHLLMI